MLIEITPVDTLFFRDGKPFSMGSESWANGIFPPYPFTIYGALRSAFLSMNEDFAKNPADFVDSDKDPTRELKIKRIFYKSYRSSEESYLMPSTYDCVYYEKGAETSKEKKDEEKMNRTLLHPVNVPNDKVFYSNVNLESFIAKEETENNSEIVNFKQVNSCYMRFRYFNMYLKNNLNNDTVSVIPLSEYLKTEPKVGIGRDQSTKASKDGKLYRVGLNRLENFSIMVEYNGIDDEFGKGLKIIKLGGEGKMAKITQVTDIPNIEKPPFKKDETHFKMVLSTPTYFKKGWFPSWIDEEELTGNLPNTDIKVKLVSAVLGKYQNIGGFDVKKRKPKPMKRFVPAGSVYYFEVLSSDFKWDDILELHGTSITDSDENNSYRNAGIGLCYIGKYKIQ